jgi:hypothetical protein
VDQAKFFKISISCFQELDVLSSEPEALWSLEVPCRTKKYTGPYFSNNYKFFSLAIKIKSGSGSRKQPRSGKDSMNVDT